MIDVALTGSELRTADVAVVIDVLRATSTVAQALAAGYEAVLCVDSLERAAGLRARGRVLAGERNCVMPPGFDQGNSPLEATQRRGKELVLATTNGAPTIVAAARHAGRVILACLLNLDAVIRELQDRPGPDRVIQIVCSGTGGAPALEDTYVAGRLSAALSGPRTDTALVAEAVARAYSTPMQALAASANARMLRAAGLSADIAYCALESELEIVPQVSVAADGIAAVVRGGTDSGGFNKAAIDDGGTVNAMIAPRPILLGIVGDSAAGKTTLTRGLVRILGEEQVTHVSADHYHRYDRKQRAERGLTPLNPEGNYLDILEQHLLHLRAGEPVLKPVYRHTDGTFAAAEHVRPAQFTIVEGLLGYHTRAMRDAYDVRVFLDPPEDLRRRWKVQRDCSRRGYTTDQVLDELDRREADSELYIRPQQHHADLVISFMPGDRGDQEHLDAKVVMRPGLVHPDLTPLVDSTGNGITLQERASEISLWVPGTIDRERSEAIQESVWDRMHFASHLRTERLGEFTVGTQLHRSESLAITQLLVLYQLVTARAALAVGAIDTRADRPAPTSEQAPRATTHAAD